MKIYRNIGGGISFGIFIMFFTHILVHSAGGLYSTLSPIIKNEFSLSFQQIGLIGAIPPLCQFFVGIPSGLLSDRIGPRKIIALSILMGAVGSLVAYKAESPWIFILAIILVTLNSTIFHPPAFSYTANSVDSEKLSRAMGVMGAGGMIGVTVGPLSISLLMGLLDFSWRQTYLFWIIPILLGLVAVFFLEPLDSHQENMDVSSETTLDRRLLKPVMVAYLFSGAVRTMGGSMTATFLSIYLAELKGWNLGLIGLLYSISNLLGVVASPIGGIFGDKFGQKKFMESTLFISYLFFIITFFIPNVSIFFITYTAYSFFNLLSMPTDSSIIASLTPKTKMGIGFAISFLPGNFVRIIAPLIAGYLANSVGLFTVFMASSVLYFLGLAVLSFFVKLN